MRILYHHRTRAGDAQGVHIAEMQRAFRARGHEVTEVALVPSAAPVSADGAAAAAPLGARWADRAARRSPRLARELAEVAYNAVAYRRLSRAIRRLRPDLVYERYAAFTLAGVLAARRHGVPIALEVNSPLAAERARHGGLALAALARAIERRACGGADLTLAVSAELAGQLLRQGAPRGRLRVLPNGVRRGFGAGSRDRGRRRLGLEASVPAVGVVAWFRAWHRLDDLVAAFEDPAIEAIGAVLVLVGGGPALDAASPRLARLVDRGRAVLAGAVQRDELEDVLAAFDVAVQPAVTPYSSPMKLVEYLAAGRAVVAPGAPNVRELTGEDGEAALLCGEGPEPSPAALRDALVRLLLDPPLRERLGAAARGRVERLGLYWEENARRVEEEVAALRAGAQRRAAAALGAHPC